MIKHAAKLFKQLQTIPKEEIPVIVPVFNLVSYAKFIVNELQNYNINSFIICDNNSTYPPMIEYLEELSKTHRVVRFDENLGPRVFAESKEFLSIMPEYFILTDPDLVFNKDLPTRFLEKMRRILDMYGVSKVGFAIDIEQTKDKFFDAQQVKKWEGSYWEKVVELYPEKDPLYSAPIDTTFCMYKKQNVINELKANPMGITSTSALRIGGRFTCEHMGWWKEQPLTKEEEQYYNNTQMWASTYNEKKRLGFI
jgi:hypothetical protein